jgi:hypothetical protein
VGRAKIERTAALSRPGGESLPVVVGESRIMVVPAKGLPLDGAPDARRAKSILCIATY